MNEALLSFLIHWAPTLVFVLCLLTAFLVGLIRGFRKSLILLIQASILFVLVIIAFFILINQEGTDAFLFNLTNGILGENFVQNALNVSVNNKSFTDCFIDYLPTLVPENQAIILILKDQGMYLAAMADMALSCVVAILLAIIYLIGVFILYLIYLIFYPQRRHVKKLQNQHEINREKEVDEILNTKDIDGKKIDESDDEDKVLLPDDEALLLVPKYQKPFEYKRRRLLGGVIGLSRGIVSSFLILSFIGAILFTITGGSGEGDYEPYDFGDEDINVAYNAYANIETYGQYGIFKILNTFKNSNNVPYYIFATELVFQGQLKDESNNYSENVFLRKELANYTTFAKDTLDLVLKYGKDELKEGIKLNKQQEKLAALTGDVTEEVVQSRNHLVDAIVSVMAKKEFQDEFIPIIDKFEETTFFANLSTSLINSFITHIDEIGLADAFGDYTVDLIKLVFQKGFFAPEIPYEATLIGTSSEELAYLSPDLVINKTNAKAMIAAVLEVLTINMQEYSNDVDMGIDIIQAIVPHVKELTVFTQESGDKVSKVLHRIYEFSLNTYVKDFFAAQGYEFSASDASVDPYNQPQFEGIDFSKELINTLEAIENIVSLYEISYYEGASILDVFFNVFSSNNPHKTEAVQLFHSVKENVSDSFLLGELLASTFGKGILEALFSSFATDLKLPEITYANTIDSSGNKVYGEFYYLLQALEAFCMHENNKELISYIGGGMSQSYDLIDLVSDAMLGKDAVGRRTVDYVCESLVFRTVFSSMLLNQDFGSFTLYIDDSLVEEIDGITLVKKSEFLSFFTQSKTLVTKLKEIDEKEQSEMLSVFISEDLYNILDSKIIEGSISKYMSENLASDDIIIPSEVTNMEHPITIGDNETEAKKILGLYRVKHFDVSIFTKEYENDSAKSKAIITMLKGLDEADYDEILKSKILYYSMSNYLYKNSEDLVENLNIIIAKSKVIDITGETIDKLIQKEELKHIFMGSSLIVPEDGNVDNVITQFRRFRDEDYDTLFSSLSLHYTMSNYLVTNQNVISSDITLIIPNSTKVPVTGEVISEVIIQEQIENTIKGALEIIPEEGDYSDLLKEFRRIDQNDTYDTVFASQILHYTMSNYLNLNRDIVSSDIPLVIPNSVNVEQINEVVERLITKEELKALIKGALNIVPEDGQITNILDTLENKTDEDFDLILESEIMQFTFSNYIIDNSNDYLGDDGDIIVPDACLTKFTPGSEVVDKVINKEDLKEFMMDSLSILPDDKDNVDVGIVINNVIKNNYVLEGLILSASLTNMLVNSPTINGEINSVLDIPSKLITEGSHENLINLTKESTWYNENLAFTHSLNALIGVELDDNHTILDGSLSNTVYEKFSHLNKQNRNESKTNLELAYDSIIMARTIAKRIDEIDILDAPKRESIKYEADQDYYQSIYYSEEIASLVDLINFLELDLTSTNVQSTAMNKTKLTSLNEEATQWDGYTGTNLGYFYQHSITGLIITEGLENHLVIPDDAKVTDKLYITESEAKYMIESLNTLNLDLNNFSFDGSHLTITDLRNCIYDNEGNVISKILLKKTSDELIANVSTLVILESDYESEYQRLKAASLYDFFNAIDIMGVVNLNEDPGIENYTLDKPDSDLQVIASSSIIRSSLTQHITISINHSQQDILIKNDTSLVKTENDINSTRRSCLTYTETYNLFIAVKELTSASSISNIEIDLTALLGSDDEDMKNKVLGSEIIMFQISEAIINYYKTINPSDPIEKYEFININTFVITQNKEELTKEQIISMKSYFQH